MQAASGYILTERKEIVKEGMMNETMEFRLGWLKALMEDGDASIPDKVDGLLTVLGEVRTERGQEIEPMQAKIALEQEIISVAVGPYDTAEEHIKGDLRRILEEFVEGEKHESELGKAQIVRPKPRISYDTKGLETLRLSLPEVNDLIGHLRKEKKSEPYLKIKLK